MTAVSRPAGLLLRDMRVGAARLETIAALTERVAKLESALAEMAARLDKLEAPREGEGGVDILAMIG